LGDYDREWRVEARSQALLTTIDKYSPVIFQSCDASKEINSLKLRKDMEGAEPRSEGSSARSSEANDSLGEGRSTRIFLTSEDNSISLQRELKSVVTRKFFRNTGIGTGVTIGIIVDYRAIQNFLPDRSLSFFTCIANEDKPVKSVIRHLIGNSFSSDIIMSLEELGYVMSVKQTTAKHPNTD
jgi:hypothetical protein